MADLIDHEDGENRAVRSFLACYGGACGVTVIQMRDHMRRSGFPFWPDWVEPMGREHLTKGGAQDWLRHLFALERTAGVAPAAPSPIGEVIKQVIAEGGFHDPGAAPSAQLDADVARLMAMTEPEIDAELRSMGMDPGETAARGRRAVERALTEIRERNAGAAPAAQTEGKS